MKRLLGVNDGYGTLDLRAAIMDELNKLIPACSITEVSDAFNRLVAMQDRRRNVVMYLALRVEEISVIAAVWRCDGNRDRFRELQGVDDSDSVW